MKRLSIFACVLLSGCAGNVRAVRIVRLNPSTPDEVRRAEALRSVYVIVEQAPPPRDVPSEGLLQLLIHNAASETQARPEAPDLGIELARALKRSGALSVVWRVAGPKEKDIYLEQLQPASILRLKPGSLRLARKKLPSPKQKRPPKGIRPPPPQTVWEVSARLEGAAELSVYPGPGVLAAFVEAGVLSQRLTQEAEPDLRSWYRRNEAPVLADLSRRVAARLAPRSIVYERPFYVKEKDKALSPWQSYWNQGVSAEQGGRWEDAKRLYGQAREAGTDSPELKHTDFNRLYAQLAAPPWAAAAPPSPWFASPLAVLPFSDETTSVDGPVLTRELVQGLLKEGGYAVVPLAQVDASLREQGFTQGGQLKAAKNQDLADWVKAERILFGDVWYYQSLPARVVSGELAVWGAQGGALWSSQVSAVEEVAPADSSAVYKRLTDESWSSRLWMPTAETLRFARRALSSLPQRLP